MSFRGLCVCGSEAEGEEQGDAEVQSHRDKGTR